MLTDFRRTVLLLIGWVGSCALLAGLAHAQTPVPSADQVPATERLDAAVASPAIREVLGAPDDGDPDALREYYRQFPLRRREQREQQRRLEEESGWLWQPLPDGRIFPSYLAGQREPRMAATIVSDRQLGAVLNGVLGGRFGVVRYGDRDTLQPEGIQLDVEGAAFPRVALEDDHTFTSSDFRAGVPLVFRRGPLELKFAYYHYCSHLGDTWQLMHPEFTRTQFTRDALVWAVGFRPLPDLRLYAEADWAFYENGSAEPWEFQFGADYSPMFVTWFRGAPFAAVNAHLREDVGYGGLFTFQAGWQWRGERGQLLRTGLTYSNGLSDQGQFRARFEEQIGAGLWYDF